MQYHFEKHIWHPTAIDSIQTLKETLNDGVDVWVFSQTQPPMVSEQLFSILSKSEQQRSRKFFTDALQRQFIVRRGILRLLLGKYTGGNPHKITYAYAKHGKPYLENSDFRFNVSHSQDLVLVGISLQCAVGVDIEQQKPIPDMLLVAKHHFSPHEQNTLFNLDDTQQLDAFYRCWTRKEAFIKVDGRGLAMPLDGFDVTLAPDETPAILRVSPNIGITNQWIVENIAVGHGYAGALIYQQPQVKIRYFHASPASMMFR